jgi:feruloyl esterase
MKIRIYFSIAFLLLLMGITKVQAQSSAELMKLLQGLNLSGITITDVQDVAGGTFTMPNGKTENNLPAFIRVAITSKPTTDSYIRIEVWLPKEGWNQRFMGTGNGGGAGSISYGSLVAGLKRGFAVANTDMGTSPNAYECTGHPEKWIDFGYRATHEMTIAAKALIHVYYKKSAIRSYFIGCSTGGQQALMEAQRFPDDYDGIIAGAPANNRTHLHASFIWNLQANHGNDGDIVSNNKMELLSKLLIQKNYGKDGSSPNDDFLTDPRVCKFETDILPVCRDERNIDSCFTDAEITTLKKIYAGPINPRTGEQIYSPLPLGGTKLEDTKPHLYLFNWVFGKDFDYTKFDFDRDMMKVDSILAPILNANNPDLRGMKNHGGKIIMYTGTSDYLVEFEDALNYYDRVVEAQNGLKKTQDFFRFYLIPGMSHCGGGPGLNEFGQSLSFKVPQDGEHDLLTALMNWVEKGIAPGKIIASTFNCCEKSDSIRFQRPIFPYPMLPAYLHGDPNLSSSYQGKVRSSGGVLIPAPKYLK